MKKPVLYLPFEETPLDYSGNGNDGLNYGGSYAKGKQGRAVSLNGVDEWVLVGNSASLKPTRISIEAWIYVNAFSSNYPKIVSKRSSSAGYWLILDSQGAFSLGLWIDSSWTPVWSGAGEISAKTWYHLVGTFDGSKVKLYKNGNGIAVSNVPGNITNDNLDLAIGRENAQTSSNYFNGVIDEVRIYNRALSDEEIKRHYEQGLARYGVVVNGEPLNHNLMGEGFKIHTNATEAMSWAEVWFKNHCFSLGDLVLIYLDYKLAFDGIIKRERVDPVKWTAYGYDRLLRWRDEPCIDAGHFEYSNQHAGAILKDLLNHYLPNEFDQTNIDNGALIDHIDGYGMYVYEFARELARRSNFDFWLEPPNKVYFKQKKAVSSGVTSVYARDILDVSAEKDDLEKRDKIIVEGRRLIKATAGTGTSKHYHTDENILTETEAQDVANALLTEKNVTFVTGDVQLKNYRPDIRAGKTVVLHAPRFGFNNETVRTATVTHSPKGTRFTIGEAWSPTRTVNAMQAYLNRLLEYALAIDFTKSSTDFLIDWALKRQQFVDVFTKLDTSVWTVSKDPNVSDPLPTVDGGLPALKMTVNNALEYVRIETANAQWGSNAMFSARLRLSTTSGVDARWGSYGTQDYIIMNWNDSLGAMRVVWRKAGGTIHSQNLDITGVDLTQYHDYRILRSPTDIKIYIDKTLKATITTDVPTVALPMMVHLYGQSSGTKSLYVQVVALQEWPS